MIEEVLEEKPSEGFDRELYFGMARRHFWHFLIPFVLGWMAVWIVSWFLPSVYRSGTLILVEQPTVPQQFVMPNVGGDLQSRLQSITQQILSRTRLLHIIDQFGLYKKFQNANPDDLVDRMRKDIEIELVRSEDQRELTAFNVYYSADNPRTSQLVTSELTNLFISENLEVRQQQSENTTQFLENQLEQARKDLSDQEAKVRDFKDKYLGALPGQLQANLQILSGFQNQLQSEQDALNRAKQQSTYLESLLGQYKSMQKTVKTGSGEAVPAGLPAIDRELDKLKAQLADLSSRYTDQHPDVRKVKDQIAKTEKLRDQIAASLKAKAADPSSQASSDPGYTEDPTSPVFQIQSQLKANQVEVSNHQRSIQELQAKIGDYQARLNQEPVREQQLTDLTRGYEQSKADYDSLLKKKNESELATNLERQQQGEHFRILDPPNLPTRPYSPNRLKLFGIGLAAGAFLGLVFSAGFELMDDRVHAEKQLKTLLPANIIAEIPDLPTVTEQLSAKRAVMFRFGSAGAVLALVLMALGFTYFRG
jgi:polysaccharide chain length determinant protein (PEP-CTERM system associated)